MRSNDLERHLLRFALAVSLATAPAAAQPPTGGYLPRPLDIHLLVPPAGRTA
jgi:hypothetical protein